MNYSIIIQEHFRQPKNVGQLPDATHSGEAVNEACLDRLRFYLRISDNTVQACTYQAEGCVPTIAAGSVVSDYIIGKTRDEVLALAPKVIEELLGGLPRTKHHVAILVTQAIQQALLKT
ncbi:MAG: iron-sulfur cluster assembly scaffold protein [Candidatus Sumerlaeaceae bacterium]|nr:iron-sulfur cluster assembly scaffold protein [Candidatus Sumerlaeaceae bacterium]